MREPRELAKADGAPAGTFSAFWRRHRGLGPLPEPLPAPARLAAAPWPAAAPPRTTIDALGLTPKAPDWSGELGLGETPGEEGAHKALDRFVAEALAGYPDGRDRPSLTATSRLSAALRFGELSPRRAAATVEAAAAADPRLAGAAEKYVSELGWRDFSYALLAAHPDLADRPLRPEFETFPFREDEASFRAWTRGRTGYPVVDAGMRQLWRTGYMHNRVRMIAASFLIKHLLIDWRRGEAWFWDTLCDADPANNPASWQWVAGSGADAAPYFRIFNPGAAEREVRPRRRLRPPLGPRARAARGTPRPRAVARAGRRARPRWRGSRQDLPGADRRPRRGARAGARRLRKDLPDLSGGRLRGRKPIRFTSSR